MSKYTYMLYFGDSSTGIRCDSLKDNRGAIETYLKYHTDKVVTVKKGKKEYCQYIWYNSRLVQVR